MTSPSSVATRSADVAAKGSRRRRPGLGRGPVRWVLAAPLLVFLALLVVFPIIYGIQSSLTSRTLLDPTPAWVGLGNYATVLTDTGFWHSVLFTLVYTVVVTAVELVLGFGLALLFDKEFPGKKFLLSSVILPIMIAPALMGIMFRLLLNANIGLVPGFLHAVGINTPLLSAGVVIPMLMALDVVQWTPFTFLLFHAALQSVPGELHEAAQLDRASYPRFVSSILLPLMTPTIFIAGFLRAIDAFRTFDTINVLTSGGPGDNTTTLSIYIYKILSAGNFGTASAAALLVALIMLPLVPIVVRRITRGAVS
ncbi:carbohydrate ABC transporter permease [Sinomonas humi]|uniref:carbohydrate ABC transporter permease n=1 Tax=Sinomonas humi TaxID=1338436 RepID=UPI00068BBF9C|nr:sugar ABC transporter permease [Sinomonas humi]